MMINRGGTEELGEKNSSGYTPSATNLIWSQLELNPGLRGEKKWSSRLDYGTVSFVL
jgi:hypothetical protein